MRLQICSIFFLFFSLVCSQQTLAADSFVTLANGHKIYVNLTPPQDGLPTLVFVNGLTYSTTDYELMAKEFRERGYGVLLYDAYGMGETLLANPMPKAPIAYGDQVDDLDELLTQLQVKPPYQLVGLSYGGGILVAYGKKYPEKVENLFLMSPYTEVIESSKNVILNQVEMTKLFFPWNTASDEELANFYIAMFAYSNYPIAEPSVLKNPFALQGVIRLTQGITPYRPVDEVGQLPAEKIHLITGKWDQYVTHDVYDRFWQQAGPAQCTYLAINFLEHKIPQAAPSYTARWIHYILRGHHPDLCQRGPLLGNPFTSYVIDENYKGFDLPLLEEL